MKNRAGNEFETFLNECNTYVWEWYIPEQFVRFGIPSLNGLWIDDKEKIFKLTTVLERVHPDDFDKIFVRRNSPLYVSDEMFEVDIRLNLAGRPAPEEGGQRHPSKWEWFGFRGKTLRRDKSGRPIHLRGVAINIDQRIRAQIKLLGQKEHLLQNERHKTDYCAGVMQEVVAFLSSLAQGAEGLISGDSLYSREERLAKIAEIKERVAHILELNDKMKSLLGSTETTERHFKTFSLWEHLAELQQVYALRQQQGGAKLYFSNQYDDLTMRIDVKLFDLLLENVINAQMHQTRDGYLTLSYVRVGETVQLTVTSITGASASVDDRMERGLGLSVCRLMAKRLWGDIVVVQEGSRIHYRITLPLDAGKASGEPQVEEKVDVFDEIEAERQAEQKAAAALKSALPNVLIGVHGETTVFFGGQHLFNATVVDNTDELLREFELHQPEIVFVDYNLRGTLTPLDAVSRMRERSDDTPIIVTSDYAPRALHRQIHALGAQYLLTNPLSLRKVNLMIRKYLK